MRVVTKLGPQFRRGRLGADSAAGKPQVGAPASPQLNPSCEIGAPISRQETRSPYSLFCSGFQDS